jgi:16S rRNA (uracil1498-N3)-methyltransferase
MARFHRFLVPFSKDATSIEIKDTEIISQIMRVLRLEAGDSIIITNGEGVEATCLMNEMTKSVIQGTLSEVTLKDRDIAREIHLYLSILKKDNFELVVQKAVELGVSKIIPITTTRTIKTNLNFERLEKIIKEAIEQSGRVWLPEISPIQTFEEAIQDAENKVLFNMNGALDWKNKLDQQKPISIFIGPEGGWTQDEIKYTQENDALIGSLGETTLRAETAAIVGVFAAI